MGAAWRICIRWTGAATLCLLAACGEVETKKKVSASVKVEQRADGLTYKKGEGAPYTGEVQHFAQGSQLRAAESWENGRPHGAWQEWWANGRLKRETTYVQGDTTLKREWYEDGMRKEVVEMKAGGASGWVHLWWPDGRLRRQTFLEGEKLAIHGQLLEYGPDGKVIWDAIFAHGHYIRGIAPAEKLAEIQEQQQLGAQLTDAPPPLTDP